MGLRETLQALRARLLHNTEPACTEGMDFGQALKAMKQAKAVTRDGWTREYKGRKIRAYTLYDESCMVDSMRRKLAAHSIAIGVFFDSTKTPIIVPWDPVCSDLFACDWRVTE